MIGIYLRQSKLPSVSTAILEQILEQYGKSDEKITQELPMSGKRKRQKKQEGKGPLGEGMCLVAVFGD